jgi:hypothetical protein
MLGSGNAKRFHEVSSARQAVLARLRDRLAGRQERGVALGLAPEFFRPAPPEDPDHPKPDEEIFYGKVSYGDVDTRARHSKVIEGAFDLIKQVEAAGSGDSTA